MTLAEKLAADNALLATQVTTLVAAALVVVNDGTLGTSQPHLDTLNTAMLAIGVTRARMIRTADAP